MHGKSPRVPLNRNMNGVVCRDLLRDTLVPFESLQFRENFRYQVENATLHHSRVVTAYLQQGDIIKMDQPSRSPDCNPIENPWDELRHAVNRMNNPPQALNELRQALLHKWAEIPAERLHGLVTSMPQRLAVIIHARDGSTQY